MIEKLLEKISSYNLFNNLFPGVLYCTVLNKLHGINIATGNILEDVVIYYLVGMIISRIGSILIEKCYRDMKIIKYAKYDDFKEAVKKDTKIDTLVETNNIYRTMLALVVTLLCTEIYIWLVSQCVCIKKNTPILVIFALYWLFHKSYIKQTEYIKNSVENIINTKEEEC